MNFSYGLFLLSAIKKHILSEVNIRTMGCYLEESFPFMIDRVFLDL